MTKQLIGEPVGDSLGDVLKAARLSTGMTFAALSEATGIARGQLYKLENNQVRKANPAQLAFLAQALGLSLYELYAAAGHATPKAIDNLSDELERKLSVLPPAALDRLEEYVDRLMNEQSGGSAISEEV